MVWNTAHEREGLPVQVHDGYICGAHDTFSLSSPCPMQHRSTGEVSASMDQRDTFQKFEFLALPELNAAVRLPHPVGIVGVEMDGYTPKRTAPVDQRRVKVGMRNRDGVQAPKSLDQSDGGVVDQRDAIPQDVAFRRAQEQCALADRELGLRADADEAWLVLAEPVVMRNSEPFERCPRLPLGRDVLALVFADRALNRWNVTRRILCAAGSADECRHGLPHSAADTRGIVKILNSHLGRVSLTFGQPLPVYPGQRT